MFSLRLIYKLKTLLIIAIEIVSCLLPGERIVMRVSWMFQASTLQVSKRLKLLIYRFSQGVYKVLMDPEWGSSEQWKARINYSEQSTKSRRWITTPHMAKIL